MLPLPYWTGDMSYDFGERWRIFAIASFHICETVMTENKIFVSKVVIRPENEQCRCKKKWH